MKLDNYELLDIIGEGGFGLVYRAKQLSTDQIVAIKVLKFDETTPEEKKQHQIARFERETQLGAKLNHPHIVKLLDKGTTEDNRLYAVFEHVEGQTLKDMIIEQNGLSAVETGELMGQILDGLAAAHAQGIVHRDLKPTNIMVTKTGLKSHAKILDFGIGAFTASFQPKDYAMLTLTKETLGTPAYSAPEQLRGEPPTTKSDLYAWGLILLECLIGSPVMRGESVGEVFEQQLSANQVPLPSAIAEHPLGKLLRNVLEKNPIHRSADAQRIAEEFTRINFQTLVGQIQMPQRVITDADVTSVTDLGYTTSRSEKRQITVLSIQLSLAVTEDAELDEEVLDTLQEDQMALTTELATRYGGYLAGSVADTITVYFGYPQKSENDARFAGRTALELISQAQKRSALMLQQHGVELDVRMGMHSGTVLLKKNAVPKGNIPNTAFSLLNRADSDQVLVSETTKTLLDPFLEFDEAGEKKLSKHGKPEMTYFLQGERQSEALSFLRPWSANRAMIGRDSEMKLVLDTWRKLDMGHGQALLVRGQAGIGKSKLIHEAKRQIGNEGANVKEVRCFPEHRNNALYPFFEMLKKYLGMLDLDETSSKIQRIREFLTDLEADIDTLLPIFCSWLSIPLDDTVTGSQLPPDQQKTMLMEAMLKLLQHLGADSKYLLVVE
ncbi:MAG: protein kinase, partial [Bacteroidota bacterium]